MIAFPSVTAEAPSVKAIVSALERERRWLNKQVDKWRPPQPDCYRRGDIISACVTILGQSPSDYSGRSRRKPKRSDLIRRDKRWTDKDAIRAVNQLIDLAVSDLEACRPLLPSRVVGPLKIARKVGGQRGTANLTKWRFDETERRDQEARVLEAKIASFARGAVSGSPHNQLD